MIVLFSQTENENSVTTRHTGRVIFNRHYSFTVHKTETFYEICLKQSRDIALLTYVATRVNIKKGL